MIRRHWNVLRDLGLVRDDCAHIDFVDKIHEKLFWLEYEQQTLDGSNNPPFLNKGVAGRVLQQTMSRFDTIEDIAFYANMDPRIITGWTQEHRRSRVINFEKFLIRYNDEILFDHIDITADITLSKNENKGRKPGAMSVPTYEWTCPVCNGNKYLVRSTRNEHHLGYRRRRIGCIRCGYRFTTKEPI